MFIRGQSLFVNVPMGLVELIVDIGMRLIELPMLSTMTVGWMGERRKRSRQGQRTNSRQSQITHKISP